MKYTLSQAEADLSRLLEEARRERSHHRARRTDGSQAGLKSWIVNRRIGFQAGSRGKSSADRAPLIHSPIKSCQTLDSNRQVDRRSLSRYPQSLLIPCISRAYIDQLGTCPIL